jgi:hypothetical protein
MCPFYNELVHLPLFIWDPKAGQKGSRNRSLVQTFDLPPTLLDFFEIAIPQDMQGLSLLGTMKDSAPVRQAGLFGIYGGHVNCTDGRYVYMRAPVRPDNQPLYQYALMPTTHGAGRAFLRLEDLREAELCDPFTFTKGCRTLKIPGRNFKNMYSFGHLLFDLKTDPRQENPLQDEQAETAMIGHMLRLMRMNDAPAEQYERLGLPADLSA